MRGGAPQRRGGEAQHGKKKGRTGLGRSQVEAEHVVPAGSRQRTTGRPAAGREPGPRDARTHDGAKADHRGQASRRKGGGGEEGRRLTAHVERARARTSWLGWLPTAAARVFVTRLPRARALSPGGDCHRGVVDVTAPPSSSSRYYFEHSTPPLPTSAAQPARNMEASKRFGRHLIS